MGKRYLAVYAPNGWQLIDTECNNEVVDVGTRQEMLTKCEELNSDAEIK